MPPRERDDPPVQAPEVPTVPATPKRPKALPGSPPWTPAGIPREGNYQFPKSTGVAAQDYAGSGSLGDSATLLESPRSIGEAYRGNEQNEREIIFRDFSRGMVTRYDRGQQPIGSCAEIRNYMLNSKVGGLEMRWGLSTHIDGSSNIPSYGAGETLTSLLQMWRFATEVPSAQNIDILIGANGSSQKKWFQKPFWDGTGTLQSDWLWWGETKTGLTINGAPAGMNITLSSGASSTNDYYTGWVIYNAAAVSKYLYITDYVGSTKILVCHDDVPSDWSSGAAVVLYRHFHDNTGFSPSYTTPIALQQGNAVLVSGGRGSTEGYKPMWSGYVGKTYFGSFLSNGTYVTEAEIKTGDGIMLQNPTVTTETDDGLDTGQRWYITVIGETDDGQRSIPVKPTTTYQLISNANETLSMEIRVYAANLNKRFRYINIFAGSSDPSSGTLDWSDYFLVERIDMTVVTGWSHIATAGTAVGYWTYTYELTQSKWDSPPNVEKENVVTHLGTTEFTQSTVSFNRGAFINDRLVVADYYDYGTALNYPDQIRYTVFASNFIAQINSLRDIDDVTQSTVEQGDETSIIGLKQFQDKLLILKERSCYYIPVTDDTNDWSLTTISTIIGCNAASSIISTPYGVMWANIGDDVYLWRGGNAEPMTTDWRPTFRALTGTASEGWYDNYAKAYCVAPSTSGFTNYYMMFFELPTPVGFAWVKHISGKTLAGVQLGSDGVIYAVDWGTQDYILKFDTTATADVAVAIAPYADTGDYTLTEQEYAQFREWWLSQTPTGGAGTFSVSIQIDGGTAIAGLTGLTKTATRLSSKLPVTSNGRTLRVKFNTGLATFTAHSLHEMGFGYNLKRRIGDKRKSL